MAAGGEVDHSPKAKPLVSYQVSGPADGKQVVEQWSWSANPGLAFILCFFDIPFFAANFSVVDGTTHVILAVITALPVVYTAQAAVRMRHVVQRRALQGARSMPVPGTGDPALQERRTTDVSSGNWLTWEPLVVTAIVVLVFSGFFFSITALATAAVWLGGGVPDPATRGVALISAVPMVVSLGFFIAGRHHSVSVGTVSVSGPGVWIALAVLDLVAMLFSGLMGTLLALATLTSLASGNGVDHSAAIMLAVCVVVFPIGLKAWKPLSVRANAVRGST